MTANEDEPLADHELYTGRRSEKFEKQIGFINANRRRLICHDLAYKTATRKARLATANSS